jgi:hypothetical protein
MKTRSTHFTSQGTPKTPEIQQQIANDARLARRISKRIHSPNKKGSKKGNRRIHNSLEKTSKTAKPRRLEFGDMNEGQARQEGSSRASRRLAVGVSEVAAEAPAHWLIVSDSESEEEAKEPNDLANVAGEATPRSSNKRLRSLFKMRVDAQVADRVEELEQAPGVPKYKRLSWS